MGSVAGTRVGGGGRCAGPGRRHRGAGGQAHLYVETGSRAPRDGAGGPTESGGGTAARHLRKGWRTTVDRSGAAAGRGTGTRADTVRQPLRPRSRHTGSGRSSTRELHPRIGDRSEEQTDGERCDASTAACGVGGGYARGVKRKPIAIITPATSFVLFTSSLRRPQAQGPAGVGGTLLLQGRGAVDVRGDRNAGEGGGD